MGERMELARLQSVKVFIFALIVLGVSLISSLGYSRPASAEGFLQKTVQCVLSVLLPYECKPSTTTPSTTPAPSPAPAAETPSNSNSSAGAPVSSPPSTTAPTAPSGNAEYMTPPAFIRDEELRAVEKVPELPASVHQRSFSYEPMAYLAYVYGVKGASTTGAASSAEVLESTSDGWRFLGLSWYWWLVGAVALAGGVMWFKRAKYKNNLSIVNHP